MSRRRIQHDDSGPLSAEDEHVEKVLEAEALRAEGVVTATYGDRVPGEARTRGQEVETLPEVGTEPVFMMHPQSETGMDVEPKDVESHMRMGWYVADRSA